MSNADHVTIHRVHTIEYTMPLKRPYGTARGVTNASTSFLIRLHGAVGDQPIVGIGEAQPRRRLSGDVDTDTAWSFFKLAAERLLDRTMACGTPEEAVTSVRELMAEIQAMAQEHSTDANAAKPFRGSLLGIEVALLDLAGRALNVPIATLLGQVRDKVEITVRTLSTQNTEDEFRKKITSQAQRYPMVRIKGKGEIDEDLQLLRMVHQTNKDAEAPKPIWMDLNEGFEPGAASTFVKRIARDIRKGVLPDIITLEQPVSHGNRAHLPVLQREADRITQKSGTGDIRIMADESIWDTDDLAWLNERGGCRAINIKTAKAGGLLASLDLARSAVEADPRTNICIGGMVGISDITTWSLVNLAKALPRLDYITAVPPGSVVQRISSPLTAFGKKTSVHLDSDQPGLGARLAYETLIPYIKRHTWFPAPAKVDQARSVNQYEMDHLRGFRKTQLDNHLLERECLLLGLNTLRTHRVGFVARDNSDNSIAFWWTKSSISSRPATAITSDKHSTRMTLARAGVPVPNGRRFGPKEVSRATAFAESIGYPVVLKPLRGTGGRSVVTDINSPEELAWAFEALKGTAYEHRDVVVEEQIHGTSCRVFVVGDDVVSVNQKPFGTVVGDGQLTVGELLLRKHKLRMRNPHLMNRAIKLDEGTKYQLTRQGVDYNTVLAAGREVVFTLNPNPQQGGETENILENLHPTFADASIQAIQAIPGLSFSGVDWIIPDIGKPLTEQRAAICELNAHPAQSGMEFPLYGKPAKVSRAIVRLSAERRGLTLSPTPAETLSVRLLVRGRRIPDEYCAWIADRSRRTGLAGWVRHWDEESVEALLSGPGEAVAALTSLAIRGTRDSTVESVECVHTTEATGQTFEVLI